MAAIECAIIFPILLTCITNVFDLASYIYQRMEVENAAQMGAQAARQACSPSMVPATLQCASLQTAVTTAIQATTLGARVSLQSGSPSEGYYCVNSSYVLQYVADLISKPLTCAAVGMASLRPGDYIAVKVTFSYSPLFSALSVAALLTTPITSSALMRLG